MKKKLSAVKHVFVMLAAALVVFTAIPVAQGYEPEPEDYPVEFMPRDLLPPGGGNNGGGGGGKP